MKIEREEDVPLSQNEDIFHDIDRRNFKGGRREDSHKETTSSKEKIANRKGERRETNTKVEHSTTKNNSSAEGEERRNEGGKRRYEEGQREDNVTKKNKSQSEEEGTIQRETITEQESPIATSIDHNSRLPIFKVSPALSRKYELL